jgi:hypothetical protein
VRRLTDAIRLRRFMQAVAAAAKVNVRIYFTGGATAVLHGWRASTVDVDLKLVPEADAIFRALPRIKEDLEVNVELVAPSDFIPVLPGWEARSPFIERIGLADFFHYDPYSQALAKIERGHAQDATDVAAMVRAGLVEREPLVRLFEAIEADLARYPAIDPVGFRRAVEAFARGER